MSGLRRRLLLVYAALVVVGTAVLFLAVPALRTAWLVPLLVQAAVLGVGVATIFFATVAPSTPVKDLAAALRALSIGQRSVRLDPDGFGLLADAARAANELAAALSEGHDPNLGEVKRRRRPGSRPPEKAQDAAPAAPSVDAEGREVVERLDAEGLGAVRKIKKSPPATDAPADGPAPTEDAHTADDEDAGVVSGETENDTMIDDAAVEPQPWEEFRGLYDAYAQAQEAEDGVPPFEEFAEALAAQRAALIEQHKCRDVRFDLKSQNGEVSFQPRLVR